MIFENSLPKGIFGKISGIRQVGRSPPILDPYRQPFSIRGVLIQLFFCFMRKRYELCSKKNYLIQFLINCPQEKGKNQTNVRRKWTDNLL